MTGLQFNPPLEVETPFGQGLCHGFIYPTESDALFFVIIHDGAYPVFIPTSELRGVRNWSHFRRRVDYPKRQTPPWKRQVERGERTFCSVCRMEINPSGVKLECGGRPDCPLASAGPK